MMSLCVFVPAVHEVLVNIANRDWSINNFIFFYCQHNTYVVF